MKHILFLFVLIGLVDVLSAQYVYTIKADSVKLTNCDSTELIIENHTQNVSGFLYNTGKGRTIFKRGAQQLSNGVYLIGSDTIRTAANAWLQGGNRFGMTGTIGNLDSNNMIFVTNGTERARIRDSGTFVTAKDAIIHGMTIGMGAGSNPGNTAVGFNALQGKPANGVTTAIGNSAAQHATGSTIAIGVSAALNSSGNGLTAIGNSAAIFVRGGYDIAIGYATLDADSVTGWHNTAIGNITARQLTTGQYNTMIGGFTAQGLSTGSYNTLIGAQVTVPGNLSNTIILADGLGTQKLYIDPNGYAGVNTSKPAGALQVNEQLLGPGSAFSNSLGGTSVTGVGSQFLSTFLPGDSITMQGETQVVLSVNSDNSLTTSPWQNPHPGNPYSTTNAPRMLIKGNGNTGIGTPEPSSKLDLSARNGYQQFRMRTTYTPSSSLDTNGNIGDFSWDANYLYIKTASGWKRSTLTTF